MFIWFAMRSSEFKLGNSISTSNVNGQLHMKISGSLPVSILAGNFIALVRWSSSAIGLETECPLPAFSHATKQKTFQILWPNFVTKVGSNDWKFGRSGRLTIP